MPTKPENVQASGLRESTEACADAKTMSRHFGTRFVSWRMCREHLVVMPRKSLSLIGLRVVSQMHQQACVMTAAKEMIAIAVEASVHELDGITIDAKPEINHPYSHTAKLAVPHSSIIGISNE